MSAIVNDGSDIIHKKLNIKLISNEAKNLNQFEIESTIEWINKNNFQKVGLQFPDELLPISIPISLQLKAQCSSRFGIMADTSFGSCCVDEVGGEHFSVDAIVHYGNACLTSTHRKLPVKYVFGDVHYEDSDLDRHVETITSFLRSEISEEIVKICLSIFCEFRYLRYSKAVSDRLQTLGMCTHLSVPDLAEYRPANEENIERFGARLLESCSIAKSDYQNVLLFIADSYDHSVKTALLGVHHRWNTMLLHSPGVDGAMRDISLEVGRVLRSRLYSVEVARSARRIGLLIGTLSADRFLEVAALLSRLMRRRGKCVYPIVVGKINAAKLANFADLDALVIVSCAETCLQYSERGGDFLRPVLTPYEMCCGCGISFGQETSNLLTNRYLTDFRELLVSMDTAETTDESDNSDMSLVTGRIESLQIHNEDAVGGDRALLTRLDADWSIAVQDRSSRSWYGLDPQLGKTAVSMVTEGRSGIAAGYENESDR